jgi:hypothetical protein
MEAITMDDFNLEQYKDIAQGGYKCHCCCPSACHKSKNKKKSKTNDETIITIQIKI